MASEIPAGPHSNIPQQGLGICLSGTVKTVRTQKWSCMQVCVHACVWVTATVLCKPLPKFSCTGIICKMLAQLRNLLMAINLLPACWLHGGTEGFAGSLAYVTVCLGLRPVWRSSALSSIQPELCPNTRQRLFSFPIWFPACGNNQRWYSLPVIPNSHLTWSG